MSLRVVVRSPAETDLLESALLIGCRTEVTPVTRTEHP